MNLGSNIKSLELCWPCFLRTPCGCINKAYIHREGKFCGRHVSHVHFEGPHVPHVLQKGIHLPSETWRLLHSVLDFGDTGATCLPSQDKYKMDPSWIKEGAVVINVVCGPR